MNQIDAPALHGDEMLFDFQGEILTPDASVKFGYENIGVNDIILVNQVEPNYFFVNIVHSSRITKCRAICPDGSEGQPCVECRSNGTTVRICC